MFFAGLGTAVPPRRYSQKECWDAVQRAPQFSRLKSSSKATLQYVLRNDANGIRTRHLALERLEEVFDIDPDTLAARFARHAAQLAAAPASGRRRVQWKDGWSLTAPAHRDALRFEERGGMLRNVLTPQVPALAAEHAASVLTSALRDAGLEQRDIRTWIWHAGGKKVLEELCAAARLEAADVERSARVLSEFGNLSSPFVYFVLELALRERAPDGWWWLSSFGAGFSCHGGLLAVSS